MKLIKSTITSIVCASMLVPVLPLAGGQAAPVRKTTIDTQSGVTLARGPGWGVGALIGGLVGGALIASAIREGRADDRDIRHCAADFRSFDPRTGTYINRDGEVRGCHYLR